MLWLHTWAGLIVGWLLFAIWLAGSLCVFWFELDYWARPELHAVPVAERSAQVQSALNYLAHTSPDARRWVIVLPSPDGRDPVLSTSTASALSGTTQFLPDLSGRQITTHTMGGRFFVDFHWTLNNYPFFPGANLIPFFLVGAAGVVFVLMCITGVVVHKRIFKDFFTFRPVSSRQRRWLDAHNVFGVLPLPFHFLIALTGVSFFCFQYLPNALDTIYKADGAAFQGVMAAPYATDAHAQPGRPARLYPLLPLIDRAEERFGRGLTASIQITDPGRDNAVIEIQRGREGGIGVFNLPSVVFNGVTGQMIRHVAPRSATLSTWDIFTSLHFAFFGGALMRWFYLICGFAGTATIATGLLLFTIKRDQKHGEAGMGSFRWFVDRMNLAVIAGPMLASIGYLWAVRLLPSDMAHRPDCEVKSFYIIWFCSLVYAFVRKPKRSWRELLGLTGMLCLGLPILGFLTPRSSLVFSIAHADWMTAGVDLTSMAVGFCVLGAALYAGRLGAPAARTSRPSGRPLAEAA